MECQCHDQWLNLLCHNACPVTTKFKKKEEENRSCEKKKQHENAGLGNTVYEMKNLLDGYCGTFGSTEKNIGEPGDSNVSHPN